MPIYYCYDIIDVFEKPVIWEVPKSEMQTHLI